MEFLWMLFFILIQQTFMCWLLENALHALAWQHWHLHCLRCKGCSTFWNGTNSILSTPFFNKCRCPCAPHWLDFANAPSVPLSVGQQQKMGVVMKRQFMILSFPCFSVIEMVDVWIMAVICKWHNNDTACCKISCCHSEFKMQRLLDWCTLSILIMFKHLAS